jgi:site-specific recombinase XerD
MTESPKHRGGLSPAKYLTADEMQRVRDFVRDRARKRKSRTAHIDHLIVEILACSGVRAAELCDLRLEDCPLRHGKPVLYVRDGKGNVSRSVDIPEALVKHIAAFCGEYHLAEAPGATPLIATDTDKKLLYRTLHRKLRRIGEEMGLTLRLKPHQLRHSFAVKLYGLEHDLLFVAQQLGHSSVTTTQIYAKTSPESARRQVEKMA